MIIIVAGKPGAGKSLYLSYLASNKILYDSFYDYFSAKKEINSLNSGGFHLELPPQKHLVYSNIKFNINKNLCSYDVDGYEIGLPNLFFKTVVLPPYSYIILDEAQMYYDSRFSMRLRDDVYKWFQIHRQNNYTVILACQRLGNIDLNIRGIADKFIVVDSSKLEENEYGVINKISINYHVFNSCSSAEKYQLESDFLSKSEVGEQNTITTDLPIHLFYDTNCKKPAFYSEGEITSFNYNIQLDYDLDIESISRFNAEHSIKAPLGYFKNPTYDKKILEKYQFGDFNYE